jgi:hypothetical protein
MADVRMTKNRWRELAAVAKARADDVTETFAGLAVVDAVNAAPYQYGRLQGSIEQIDGEGAAMTAARRIVVGQYYGLFQEKGTKTKAGAVWVPAHPFLEPAVENHRAAYLAAIAGVVSGGW